MRRADWLISYSHEHQHTLAAALRLSRAAANRAEDVSDASRAFLADAAGEIAAHMHREETQLLPMTASLDALETDEVQRVAREHLAIRMLTMQLTADPRSHDLAARLADTAREHVRWEERELFPALQTRIEQAPPLPADVPSPSNSHLAAHAGPAADGAMHALSFASLTTTSINLAPRTAVAVAADQDVAVVVTDGTGMLVVDNRVDGDDRLTYAASLAPGTTALVGTDTRMRFTADAAPLAFAIVEQRQRATMTRRRSD